MKNKSIFSNILLLVILSLICVVLTVTLAFLAGSVNFDLIDFKNLNFSNMLPVLIIGGFISLIVVGFTVLFIGRAVFLKVRDYFFENNNDGGNTK